MVYYMYLFWRVLGRQYDSKGKLKEWWDPYTAELFRETTQCMRDQYDGFKLGGLQVRNQTPAK